MKNMTTISIPLYRPVLNDDGHWYVERPYWGQVVRVTQSFRNRSSALVFAECLNSELKPIIAAMIAERTGSLQ